MMYQRSFTVAVSLVAVVGVARAFPAHPRSHQQFLCCMYRQVRRRYVRDGGFI